MAYSRVISESASTPHVQHAPWRGATLQSLLQRDSAAVLARNIVPNTVCSEHLFRTLSQNHPQDHQNHLQDHQKHTYKEPPKGGCAPLGGLLIGVLLMVLEVVLVVLGVVLRQCSVQMFGTDVRNRQCSEQCSEPTKVFSWGNPKENCQNRFDKFSLGFEPFQKGL